MTTIPKEICPDYISEDGVVFSNDKTILLDCPKELKGDYIIPDTVVEIDDYAFAGCSGLTSITIPASVKKIGICAFADCTGLTYISIPCSTTWIAAHNAFHKCPAYIEVHPENPVYISENGKLIKINKK